MAKYTSRPIEVDAVRWGGDNWDEVQRWIMSWNFDQSIVLNGDTIQIVDQYMTRSIPIGWWLVCDDGKLFGVADSSFHTVYEPHAMIAVTDNRLMPGLVIGPWDPSKQMVMRNCSVHVDRDDPQTTTIKGDIPAEQFEAFREKWMREAGIHPGLKIENE